MDCCDLAAQVLKLLLEELPGDICRKETEEDQGGAPEWAFISDFNLARVASVPECALHVAESWK